MIKLLPTFAPEAGTSSNGYDKKPYRGSVKRGKPAKAAKGRTARTKKAARTVDPGKLDAFGLRKGSLKSQAAALYASKRGATLNEVKAKLNSVQFNVISQLKKAGYKFKLGKETGTGTRTATRYYLQAK